MYRLLSALLFITLTIGCKKETHQPQPPEPPQPVNLLTSGKWLLISYGWDDDLSGDIEANEELIRDCEKDNTTEYFKAGNGKTHDNQVSCNYPSESEFEWKLIDNDKAIEISSQRLDIQTLTKDELHFKINVQYITVPLHTKYRKL